jgi:hypothetical protein
MAAFGPPFSCGLFRARARPESFDSDAEWSPLDGAPERQKGEDFGIKKWHYQPKKAQKRPKKGQNRPLTVTDQLTMFFGILFILCGLR